MLRIVVHAGFHKTGTTTVQNTLRANARLLKPHLQVFLRRRMPALCDTAQASSVSCSAEDMAHFRHEATVLAEGLNRDDPRPILLTSEDLAGRMPGRRKLTGYDAVPHLMRALVDTLTQVHPGAEIRLYFSTRAADPWLVSCHAQHLRVVRMVMDAETYARAFRSSANLDAVVQDVANTVSPVPVSHCALETSSPRRLGPLDPLLDLLDLPFAIRAQLVPQAAANPRYDPPILQALLDANRDHVDPRALKYAKRSILSAVQSREPR